MYWTRGGRPGSVLDGQEGTDEGVPMRPVILQMGVTLDGYVTGTGGKGDWGLPAEHPDVAAWKIASLRQTGTHIMGRVTYQEMAQYWPATTGPRRLG